MLPQKPRNEFFAVLVVLWLVIFLLYLPAAKAGFVVDFTGWLDEIRKRPFLEYINRTHFSSKSLYQLTQFLSWVFYKLLGTNPWAWHILFITLQAINGTLLFSFVRKLAAEIRNSRLIALTAAFLFCISPYVSEVIVWEPSFHYLLGMLLLLAILTLMQRFMDTGGQKYILFSLIAYACSVFSLEYFYLTPFLVLAYALFRRSGFESPRFKKVFYFGFLPMLMILISRVLLYRVLYNDWVSRIGESTFRDMIASSAAKPLKYLFHLLFFGRFWEPELKKSVYAICEAPISVYSFYITVLILATIYIIRFKKLSGRLRSIGLFLLCAAMATVLVLPMWFQELMLLQMDRYGYMIIAFGFVALSLLIWRLPKKGAIALAAVYSLFNIGFTLKLNKYWYQSAKITQNLLESLPRPGNRITLLLNVPESLNGIPMIGATSHGEFKLMYDLLMPEPIPSKVYDVVSFNMVSRWDGVHAEVVNDSTVIVTLNQWGTWWWRNGLGAVSYETEDYKVKVDGGLSYELILRKPAGEYMLLFLVDGGWKEVDLEKKKFIQY